MVAVDVNASRKIAFFDAADELITDACGALMRDYTRWDVKSLIKNCANAAMGSLLNKTRGLRSW